MASAIAEGSAPPPTLWFLLTKATPPAKINHHHLHPFISGRSGSWGRGKDCDLEDCQFVCITQADYYKILHEGEDALVREEDEQGELVKVSEVRRTDDGQKHAKVIWMIF